MTQSICHIVPGVQPDNLPSPKTGNRARKSACTRYRPVPEDFEPAQQPAPKPLAKPRNSPARKQVSGVQHEIRTCVRRQKQPCQKRPPSATAVHIYERAVIQEVPQRQVAQEFGVTQSAVSRKCAKVIAWMGRCGVKELRGMNDAERGRYLVRFAERKYDHYREQAEAAHRQSLDPQVILVETGTREANGTPGVFQGAVTIRKTVRPQTGKPSYLREARLAVDSMVLLDWNCIGPRQLDPVPDPDEVARKEQEELCKQTLERNRRLEWELKRAQEEIGKLKEEAELNWGRESLAPTNSPHVTNAAAKDSRPPAAAPEVMPVASPAPGGVPVDGVCAAPTRGGRESLPTAPVPHGESACGKDSRPQPAPSEGLSSREREADGLAFLEEIKQVIATLDTARGCDATYHQTLTRLYEISRNNYRHHGIIPERQKLPTLKGVRGGLPYSILIPDLKRGGPKEFDEKEYFRKYCGIR